MQTKPADQLYCGVRKKKIANAQPKLEPKYKAWFKQYITRRYRIHIKKDVEKLPPPWTNDPVLQEYRFTNVRREHDRETLWLIKHIVNNPKLTLLNKYMNIILFRLFNKHETMELLSAPLKFFDEKGNFVYKAEKYRYRMSMARERYPDVSFFTGAFITGGLKRALKWYLPKQVPDDKIQMEMRVLYFMEYLGNHGIVKKISTCKTQAEVYELLQSQMGIGPFLGYQIFVDFTYISRFPFSENEFVVAGPGCISGLKCLFTDTDGMSYEECLFWLRDNFKKVYPSWDADKVLSDLPEEDRVMNVMSLENCFCEFSKYVRALEGRGRPRKKYKPHKEEL